jgi:hypothetical protein
MEWFQTNSTRRADGGLSRKKTPCFCHGLETQTGISAMTMPDGSLVEPWRNDEKYGGGFGIARHTFCHVFQL